MRSDRLPGANGADFAGRVVADRENEIHLRGAMRGELVPVLGPQALGMQPVLLEEVDGERVDLACRVATSAVRDEAPSRGRIQIGLGEDRPRRVARADEQYVQGGEQQAALRSPVWIPR